MNARFLASAVLSALLLLAGCGGGDGGTDSGPAPSPGGGGGGGGGATPALTFTPTIATVSTYVGSTTTVTVVGNLSAAALGQIDHLEYDDPDDFVDSIGLTHTGPLTRSLLIRTSPAFRMGVNSGTVHIHLCRDANCETEVEGSPFALPIQVTVLQPPAPQISQASLSLSVEQLSTQTTTLDVTFPAMGSVAFGVSDPDGRFANLATIVSVNGPSHLLRLTTVPIGSAGSHQGFLTLHACPSSSCGPANDYPNGAVTIPYTINVMPLPKLQVSPASVAFSIEQHEPLEVVLDVTVPGAGPLVLRVRDSEGLFPPVAEVVSTSGQEYSLRFTAAEIATPGIYSGSLTLAHCPSLPCDQDLVLSAVGVAVPYTITVTPEVPLAAVPTLSGLPEWETFQGNAAHTGHVPVTLDPSTFAHRWTWMAPDNPQQYAGLGPVTTGSGKVIVADAGSFRDDVLYALSETDGTVAWQHNFDAGIEVRHPATWGGRVFVATTGGGAAMWTFDLADGSRLSRQAFLMSSSTPGFLAPAVRDGMVYSLGRLSGGSGGMYAFKGSTGTQRWAGSLQWFDLWSPAVDDAFAYAHTGGELAVLDRFTGQRVFTIENSAFSQRTSDYSLNTAPVLPGGGSIVVVDALYTTTNVLPDNHLIAYDGIARTESWRVTGQFASNPAVVGGTIYVLNALTSQLEARSLATGQMLWAWSPPGQFERVWLGNLIVTDNIIFLSTNQATHAIDLATRQAVWSNPARGRLALSSSAVLYISASDRVHAFALQ